MARRLSVAPTLSFVLLLIAAQAGTGAHALETRNVILMTLDGVRIEELFAGMDAAIAATQSEDDTDIALVRERYAGDTARARREALMPFFWKTLAPRGMVLGNPALGSRVTVKNPLLFSYPGYAEILSGEPQPEVQSNDPVRYGYPSVLDYIKAELELGPTQVAQIGSWDGFAKAASRADNSFFMNGAYDDVPPDWSTPEMDRLTALRKLVMELWEEGSNDALTFELGLAYLKRHRPRALWLGFSQSDDWAHAGRYDRLLEYLHLMDGLLAELWGTLERIEQYRGRTTVIITTDHGRGRTPADWTEHDAHVQGSEDIWIAVIGPDTPDRGEVGGISATQSDIAATLLQFLGLDRDGFNPRAGPPLPGTLTVTDTAAN